MFAKGAKAMRRGKIVFPTNGSGKVVYPHAKKELGCITCTIYKNYLKLDLGLHVKPKTVQLVGESITESLLPRLRQSSLTHNTNHTARKIANGSIVLPQNEKLLFGRFRKENEKKSHRQGGHFCKAFT